MTKKHDTLENIRIEKLIFGGSGLATAPDGRRIIVSGGAIPDAVVDLRILKSKKNHLEAQILRTIKRSPLEQDIPSEWQLYGGCKWLPIPYAKQLEIKWEQIHEAFYPILKRMSEQNFSSEVDWLAWDEKTLQFHPIIPSPETEHYRNKVEFSWGKYISDREWIHDEYRFGFHVQGQFDRIEDCRYCVLATNIVNAIFRDIDWYARGSGIPTYDPKRADGFWRHLVVREGKKTWEIMVVFSVNGIWKGIDIQTEDTVESFFTEMVWEISKKYPQIASIYFLENTGRADIVTGNPVLLHGKSTITDELLGLTFEIAPKSFFQVNTLGAEKLYTQAIEYIHNKWGILLDLYAGTGTIGILLAKYFQKVYSVELVESASRDGEANALRNSIPNVEFVNAKVEDFAAEFAKNSGKADTIVLDPPRDGLHPSAIPHILSFGASEIIYVSCNPSTLVRDLQLMIGDGFPSENTESLEIPKNEITKTKYCITDITPMDMFPHTHHIETVVRLEKI